MFSSNGFGIVSVITILSVEGQNRGMFKERKEETSEKTIYNKGAQRWQTINQAIQKR